MDKEYLGEGTQVAKYREYGENYIKNMAAKEIIKEIDAVDKVQGYIIQHVGEKPTVENLASLVYLSPDYLTRAFKKRYVKTVIDYLAEYRIG